MGMDVYAGTLTRYYAHNWKTVTQQWAEANGMGFHRITADGTPADAGQEEDPREIQQEMESWRDQILAAITPEGREPYPSWEENNEKPYYTEKPDWDAFGALLLYASAKLYEERVPPTVEKYWDFNSHPLIRRMYEDQERCRNWTLFQGGTWWLPLKESFYFQGPTPAQDGVLIGTVGLLRAELEKINAVGWQAGEEMILSWSQTEGYPADAEIQADGQYKSLGENTRYDTESLAKFAFSILWQAVKFSQENQVPILLDY